MISHRFLAYFFFCCRSDFWLKDALHRSTSRFTQQVRQPLCRQDRCQTPPPEDLGRVAGSEPACDPATNGLDDDEPVRPVQLRFEHVTFSVQVREPSQPSKKGHEPPPDADIAAKMEAGLATENPPAVERPVPTHHEQMLGGASPIVPPPHSEPTAAAPGSNTKLSARKRGIFRRKGGMVTQQLLTDLTGTIEPGTLTAILGPSGAGKTTFLNVLAGRIVGNLSGKVLINGRPREELGTGFMRRVGYVMQDDVMMATQTPREIIEFSARLRLPRTYSKQHIERRVEAVVRELYLQKAQNTRVGSPGVTRGVSGGELKRTAIAAGRADFGRSGQGRSHCGFDHPPTEQRDLPHVRPADAAGQRPPGLLRPCPRLCAILRRARLPRASAHQPGRLLPAPDAHRRVVAALRGPRGAPGRRVPELAGC
eukprot:TRINITY_DN9511_c0_g2_i2.p1 TRINITY_DN9511_c0_g2~~TRINITY_DN9511_c0_g2_i2.p1  ORF type:complete len:424 (-),score=45.25 TRINITY_DN9511_c0_g2_i2:395-1666(-)